jgi:poly(3-hydroxybutyrate) depolymerase
MNTDKSGWVFRVVAMFLASVAIGAFAGTPVPGGKWSWVWKDAKGRSDTPMRVYTYRPRDCDSTCPIVMVLHGRKRNASAYRDYWELLADHYKVMIIAPEFSKEHWPRAADYNLGGMGQEQDRNKWVFATIEHLFDEMRVDQKSYVLFGHGAGAQVAQRMALLWPDNRASAIVVANPGWYTMPEFRKDKAVDSFPYSVAGAPGGEPDVRKALARRLVLMVGEGDEDPDDEGLAESSGAKKQGETRTERGENFFKAATTVATDLGVKLAWELNEMPDNIRDGEKVSKAAADAVLKK